MRERFQAALPFSSYLDTVVENEALWRGVSERVRLPDDLVEEARALPGTWHLLALSEDWCGDAANSLPALARFTDALPGADFRVLSRDENPDLMDAHLTNGGSRSIPVVMLLDEDYGERGWWGPRPHALQRWVMEEGLKMEAGPRYREIRKFYARDKGRSTLIEILELMRSSAL